MTLRTVTVLFTDLVDSTASVAGLGPADADRWRDAHFASLREPLAAHHGHEVKNLGDGLMAVFDSAAHAIDAAVAMQQAVDAGNRAGTGPAQSVRIGISLGEAVEEDGDYFGDPVVEAARLCAAADGGQVLLTRLVELTAGRRTEQRVVGLGPRILKGFSDPVEVAEVRWDPLPNDATSLVLPIPRRCLVEPPTGFVGRDQHTELLSDALKEVAATGGQQVVMIGGEPGMGKTTLATTFARRAHTSGATVLFGHADEELGLPYQAWVEVLRHLADHAPASVAATLDAHQQVLTRILPLAGAAPIEGTDVESARYALFEAVRAVLAATAELAPLVVVLDDLQWADAPSLALLRHLITASEPVRALIIGTYRDSDVVMGRPLSDLLAGLHREPGAHRMSLRGLDDAELSTLMEAASGHELDADGVALRDALLAETDGNPFFVGELLRHLVETRAIYVEGDRWVPSANLRAFGLPVSVHEVIGRRIAALGENTVRILETASVVGREFDVDTLVAALDGAEDEVLEVMDAATAARVLVNMAPERYTFAHALVEHSLYDAISPTRRARLHRRIAEVLEELDQAERERRVAELASHWAKATTAQDATKAISYAIAAGDRALAQLAPDEGVRWYSQALELAEHQEATDRPQRARILAGLGDAQRHSGIGAYRETLLEAARLAIEVGDTDLLITSALTNTRGFQSNTGITDHERVEVLRAALEAAGPADSTERAMLLANLTTELLFEEPFERHRERFDEALRIARALGDRRTVAAVITTGLTGIDVPETLEERRGLAREALAAAQQCDDPVLEFWARNFTAYISGQAGDLAECGEEWRRAAGIAARLNRPILQWVAAYGGATRQIASGDLAAAEREVARAVDIGRSTEQPDIELFYIAQYGQLRMLQGTGGDEHAELLRSATELTPRLMAPRVCLARLLCDLGRDDEAADTIAPVLPDNRLALRRDLLWLGMTILTAETCCHLGLRTAAANVYDELLPHAGRFDNAGSVAWGCADDALGLLADHLGRDQAAVEHFEAALAIFQRAGAAYFLTRTQIRLGSHLMRRGDGGRGEALIRQGLGSARERDYPLLVEKANQALTG